jgi:TRAP-type uncharacterized transport system fused permease subunit
MAMVEVGSGSTLVLLAVAAVICIILGMGMPPIGVYVLLAVAVAPSLVEVGVSPLAAHMFIFYLGMMSMVTPPVAIAAFFAANLAGSPPMKTGYTAMRFGWTAYIVPFLFVFAPSLLMQGSPLLVVQAVATALFGVWLISAGFVGYLFGPLGLQRRVLFCLAGFLLLVPAGAASWGEVSDMIGFALAVVLLAFEATTRRRRARPSPGVAE